MSDEEYVYEEDEEYMSDGDGDCEEDSLEGIYYDAKDRIPDEPESALEGFQRLLEMGEGTGSKWVWKAMKRLVRVCFTLKRYDEMLDVYKQLLHYDWEGRTRNDTEKAINKLLDMTPSSAGPSARMYDITTEFVSQGTRNEKLWFSIKMKSAQSLLESHDFERCSQALQDLKASCRVADTLQWDTKKGTQLMTVFAVEMQLCQDMGDHKLLKHLYEQAMQVEGAIPPPKITGIIREAGGKMYMQQGDYEQANEAFFQAFKHYDEAGHPKRIQCLKYLVLANMMSRSKINPFDCQEAKPYRTDPEIGVMTGLIDAASQNDIDTFERILRENKKSIMSDALIKEYITPLLRTVRTQVLQLSTKAYTSIKLSYLASELSIPESDVEELLVAMLLDDEMKGGIDQVKGVLHLGGDAQGQDRYHSLQKWASQVGVLHSTIGTRLLY